MYQIAGPPRPVASRRPARCPWRISALHLTLGLVRCLRHAETQSGHAAVDLAQAAPPCAARRAAIPVFRVYPGPPLLARAQTRAKMRTRAVFGVERVSAAARGDRTWRGRVVPCLPRSAGLPNMPSAATRLSGAKPDVERPDCYNSARRVHLYCYNSRTISSILHQQLGDTLYGVAVDCAHY